MTDNTLSDSNPSSGSKIASRKVVKFVKRGKLETTSRPQDKSHSRQEVRDEEEDESDVSSPPLSLRYQEAKPRTPKRAIKAFAKDTPRTSRMQEGGPFRSSFVLNQRQELLASLGWKCFSDTMDYFFEHVLPPLRPDLKVDDVFEECIRQRILAKDEETNKFLWKGLPDKTSVMEMHEKKVYNEPLKDIFSDIIDIAEGLSSQSNPLTRKAFFRADGDKSTWSLKNVCSKPDAQVFMITPGNGYPPNGIHWYNVACSLQFKKAEKKSKIYENLGQIIHNLQECMYLDVCRRFTLGITIECSSVRVWILSRSFLIASESFDFNDEPRKFIGVVLSLMFSNKADLGWDTKVEDSYDGKKRLFVFDVSGKRYSSDTDDLLMDVKAAGLYTTGTRIFRVYRESDEEKKKPLILKDYWPALIHDTEVEIRVKILDNIIDLEEHDLVKRALLTPAGYEIVSCGDYMDTEGTILRGKSPSSIYEFKVPDGVFGRKKDADKSLYVGLPPTIGNRSQGKPKGPFANGSSSILHRRHCRIIYKEDAIAYHKLTNIKDMLLVLEHSIDALRVIHMVGWVHRDLSPMNLYLYTDPKTHIKRGIIGDLEFAKKAGTGASSDIRTGSSLFTSIEIVSGKYKFTGFKDHYRGESSNGIYANYLHDLESIFWIFVWTIFTYRKETTDDTDFEAIRLQRETGDYLFLVNKDTENNRYEFLTSREIFNQKMKCIPEYFDDVKKLVRTFKKHLIKAYRRAEKRITANNLIEPSNRSVHDSILKTFRKINIDGYCVIPDDVELVLTSAEPPPSLKHSLSNEDMDEKSVKKQRTKNADDAVRVLRSSRSKGTGGPRPKAKPIMNLNKS